MSRSARNIGLVGMVVASALALSGCSFLYGLDKVRAEFSLVGEGDIGNVFYSVYDRGASVLHVDKQAELDWEGSLFFEAQGGYRTYSVLVQREGEALGSLECSIVVNGEPVHREEFSPEETDVSCEISLSEEGEVVNPDDENTKIDLANVAFMQEYYLDKNGRYATSTEELLSFEEGMLTLGTKTVIWIGALREDGMREEEGGISVPYTNNYYVVVGKSPSGMFFMRSSEDATLQEFTSAQDFIDRAESPVEGIELPTPSTD